MSTLITRKQIEERLRRIKNLRKEYKSGSWLHWRILARVEPVSDRRIPHSNLTEDLYAQEVVKQIADAIGYKES